MIEQNIIPSHRKKGFLKSFQDLFEKLAPGGLVPPQAVPFEQSLLGACMIDKTSWERSYATIGARTTEDTPFYRDAHAIIWNAICGLVAINEPVDLLEVTNQLRKMGKLDEVGGPSYLVELTTQVVTTVNIESHARVILEKWISRETIRICEETKLRGFEGEFDTFELLDSALDQLMKLSAGRSTSSRPKKASERIKVVLQHIENASKGALPGVSTGFADLDRVTLGLGYGTQTILAAGTSEGKSSLSAFIALNAAKRGEGVVIFSQEMKDIALYLRMLASETGISQHTLKGGLRHSSDQDWRSVTETMHRLGDLPLWIDDTRKLNPTQIRTRLRQITRSNDIKLVVVDYLQLLQATSKHDSRNHEIESISGDLFSLWGDMNAAGLVLSQLNRGDANSRQPNKPLPRPQLWSLRESGAIEQDADDVYFVYHPRAHIEGYKGEKKVIVELIHAKARGGATGSVWLTFDKPRQSFTECEQRVPFESDETYIDRMEAECRRPRFPVFDGQKQGAEAF
jgi:replicative DNA helicase